MNVHNLRQSSSKREKRNMNGQSSMIAMVLAMVLVVFIIIFMLSSTFSGQADQTLKTEFRDMYTNNLLLSLLATDTKCGTFSDMLKEEYFEGRTCFSEKLGKYMKGVLNATGNTNYAWLIEVEPKDFQGVSKQWGDTTVKDEPGYWDARTILSWSGRQLEVKLYIKTK